MQENRRLEVSREYCRDETFASPGQMFCLDSESLAFFVPADVAERSDQSSVRFEGG